MDKKLIAFAVFSFIICVISALASGLKPWGLVEIEFGSITTNMKLGLWRTSVDGTSFDGKDFDDDTESFEDDDGLDDKTQTLKTAGLGNRGTTIIAVIGTLFGTIVFGAMASGIIENNTQHVMFLGILYIFLGIIVIIFGILWTTSYQEAFSHMFSEMDLGDDFYEMSSCVLGCGLDLCAGVLLLIFGILVIIQARCFSSNAANDDGVKTSDVELA